MKDFFISYTAIDKGWAEWVAFVLEEIGFETIIQEWDFRPGSNFVLEMQSGASGTSRTIAILSPDYLKSGPGASEWAAAFSQDPTGVDRKLVPVMVRQCTPTGLLASIVQIRLYDLEEPEAHSRLVNGINRSRAKPVNRPKFPGQKPLVQSMPFPGRVNQSKSASPSKNVLPKLNVALTDADKRQFLNSGFDSMKHIFEENLSLAAAQNSRVTTGFELTNSRDFSCELFVDGNLKCECRIWQGCMGSKFNICYSDSGDTFRDSCNEIISLSGKDEPFFKATMQFHASPEGINCNRMTAEQTAEFLWSRFIAPIASR